MCSNAVPDCGRSTSLRPDLSPLTGGFFLCVLRLLVVTYTVFYKRYEYPGSWEEYEEIFDTLTEAEAQALKLAKLNNFRVYAVTKTVASL